MGRHLDVDQILGHVGEAILVLARQAREHQLFVGVFMIDEEQPMLGVVGPQWQR